MIKRWHVLPILAILMAMIVVVVSPPPSAHAASAGSPSALAEGSGNLQVFNSAANTNQLQHWWYSNGWNGPVLWSGGNGNGSPSAVSWGSGRLDVFTTGGPNYTLQHWWSNDGVTWGGPESLG